MTTRLVQLLPVVVVMAAATGCLDRNYTIHQDELVRLAHLPPTERWQAVHATQHIRGGDDPPENWAWAVAPAGPTQPDPGGSMSGGESTGGADGGKFGNGGTALSATDNPVTNEQAAADAAERRRAEHARIAQNIAINATIHVAAAPPPRIYVPHLALPRLTPPLHSHFLPGGIQASSFLPFGGGSSSRNNSARSRSGGSGGGGGDALLAEAALLVGAAVVVSVVALAILVPTEGLRYDGYVAVNPDEPLFFRVPGEGALVAVRLSELDENIAYAATDGARIYEGGGERYAHLARMPLDRAGFIGSLAAVGGTSPVRGGGSALSYGARVTVGYNILGWLSVALAADVLGAGPDGSTAQTLLNAGGEFTFYPIRYAGVYAGAAYASRGTTSGTQSNTDSGYTVRAGFVGELPMSTFLAAQLRAGVTRTDLSDGNAPVGFEASLGFAVY